MAKRQINGMGGTSKLINLIVYAFLASALFPYVVDAITNLSATLSAKGVPLAGLFANSGVVSVLLVVSIFYGILKYIETK
jgi:hypothetical protein